MRRIGAAVAVALYSPDWYALAADRNRNGESGPGGRINR